MEKEITILIPTHNRGRILVKTLEAINAQTYDLNKVEVLVIDDFSEDNPKRSLTEFLQRNKVRFQLRYFRMPRNSGQGMVRNRGVGLAEGRMLFFLGDDTIPKENFIHEHMKVHHENEGEEIAVLGRVFWADEVRNDFMNYIENIQFHYQTIKDKNNVKFHFYTSNISLAKKWFRNEKYSEAFKNYGLEDLEIGYRLENNGLRVVYNPEAIVYHHHSYDFRQFCDRMVNVGRSAKVFVELHPELKRKFIPLGINILKWFAFLLSRKKIFSRRLYWYSNFIYCYIKGLQNL